MFFTLTTAVLAGALLVTGGLQALQTAAIIIALPFSVVMLMMCWSTVAFSRGRRAYERAARAHFVDQIGEHYGLEVEESSSGGVVREPSWLRRVSSRLTGRPVAAGEVSENGVEKSDAAEPADDDDVHLARSEN